MITEALVGAVAAGIVLVLAKIGEVIVNVIKAKKEPDQTELAKIEHNQKTEAALEQIQTDLVNFTAAQAQTNKMLLKREICSIYWQFEHEKRIPEREFESAFNIYTVYRDLGGNGLAQEYINEIKTWERY